MMEKYRVHEVAKDLGVPSKEIIELLGKYFGDVKKHMTALEDKELSVVFEYYTRLHAVESFDEYFAEARAKREAAHPQPQPEPEPEPKAAPAPPPDAPVIVATAAPPVREPVPARHNKTQPPKDASAQLQPARIQPGQKKPAQSQQGGARPGLNQFNRNRAGQSQPSPGQNQQQKPRRPQQRPAQPRPATHTVPYRPPQPAQPTQVITAVDNKRHVDMRGVSVNLDKYNERYETIAPTNLAKKDTGVRKQKLNQKSAQRGKPFMSRKEQEAQKLKRLDMERQRRQKLDITLPEEISVSDLASRLKIQTSEVVKRLMGLGIMAAAGQIIDYDAAAMVAMEIGAKVSPEVIVTIEERLFDEAVDTDEQLETRPPIVVVMGHVDHGKTSLLDAIRDSNVTKGEAGGITQHIGAYQVPIGDGKITFLDTPGHAAFTSMRARGAQVTDIAVLVVAADDGVMPQTVEAINHAKAAGVSIIIAINKIDKPDANPERVKQELTEYELVPEEWGGDTICVNVSAVTGENIGSLLEMIQLVSEMKELKANPDRAARGTVVEARLDKGRGPVATLLVQNGTLKTGDIIIAGTALGHVRVMLDDKGEKVGEAGPSTPVEITGLSEAPQAGDVFNVVEDEKLARELVEKRRHEAKEEQFNAYQKVTLDNLFSQISEGEIKELPIIVKADVQGSVEAVRQSLEKISNEEVRVRVIHGAVGAISESDIMLADASNAIIVGFNVRPEPVAKETAERVNVEMRLYRIIYDAIDEIEKAIKGMRAPKHRDVDLGRAEVRTVYKISNVGTVAGCYVQDGKITRSAKIRLVRDGIVVTEDMISSLRRFKDDVREVAQGYECGIGLEKYSDVKDGDIFEAFITEEYRE